MSAPRTLARTAAVLGAATALTVAGAGAAMATTHDSSVDGNTVSVTFTLDEGFLDGDTCGAVLTPTAAAPALAQRLADGDVRAIIESLVNDESVTVLYEDGVLDTPFATLAAIGEAGKSTATVSASDVPSNVYALVSVCLSDSSNPNINPFLLVGDPMEAVMGSVEMGSSNGGLDTASALLEGAGDEDGGSITGMLGGAMLGDTGSAGDDAEQE